MSIASRLRRAKFGSGHGLGRRSRLIDRTQGPSLKDKSLHNPMPHTNIGVGAIGGGHFDGTFPAEPPTPFGRGWAAAAQPEPAKLHAHVHPQFDVRQFAPQPRLIGALALLHNPHELDGEGLGKAATAAAREGVRDAGWWSAITARAKQLAPSLSLHDAALVLNGMARSRQLDKKLVELLLPRIASQMVYLTSAHLAMLSSAVAKAEVHNPQFVGNLTRELKARLMEFHSSMELTMIINSVSKLRVTDEDLYRRFATQIQGRMHHETFHVRDLSVIVSALSRVHCTDVATVGRFAECAMQTLGEATPLELARLLHACISVTCNDDIFFDACVTQARSQTLYMDPSGLSAAAFAFGQCFEAAQVDHMPYLRQIFRDIRLASVASLPLFLPREVVGLLRTYARWQITFDCEHLQKVADRMYACRSQFELEGTVSALYSLAKLMQRNAMRSVPSAVSSAAWDASAEAARGLLPAVWTAMKSGHLNIATSLRALEASMVLCSPSDTELLEAISICVLRRKSELDGPICAALYDTLLQLGCSPEKDIMLVLEDSMTPLPF